MILGRNDNLIIVLLIFISFIPNTLAVEPSLPNCCEVDFVDAKFNENNIALIDGKGYYKYEIENKVSKCQEKFTNIVKIYNQNVNKCCKDGKANVYVGYTRKKLVDGKIVYYGVYNSPSLNPNGCYPPGSLELKDRILDSWMDSYTMYKGESPNWLVSIYQTVGSAKTASNIWDQESCANIEKQDDFLKCVNERAANVCYAPAYFGFDNPNYIRYSPATSYGGAAEDAMEVCVAYLNDFVKAGIIIPKASASYCDNGGNGCCEGYKKTKHNICCKDNEISYIGESGAQCVPQDTFPRYKRVEIKLKDNVLNLDGKSKIDVSFKFIGTDENNNEVPMINYRVPALFAESDNTAYTGDILGSTSFKFNIENQKFHYTNQNGIFHTSVSADKIQLGNNANKINEAKIYVYTGDSKNYDDKSFFTLTIPKFSIKRIYKETSNKAARPGAFSTYVIEFNDAGNLQKTLTLNAAGGTFKYQDEITTVPKIKITTSENKIIFGWMPPDMGQKFRVNQLEALHTQLLKLQDDYKNYYIGEGTNFIDDKKDTYFKEKVGEKLNGKFTVWVPDEFDRALNYIDMTKKTVKHLNSSLNTYKEMSEDYERMFDEDATLTEQLTRGFLMTQGAYEITDGTISLVTNTDDDIKSVTKARALEALKDSLRKELQILEAAKGKEFGKTFALHAEAKAGGAKSSSDVRLYVEAPILTYEGS